MRTIDFGGRKYGYSYDCITHLKCLMCGASLFSERRLEHEALCQAPPERTPR